MTKVSAISKVSVATVELPPTSPGSPGAAVGNGDDNESVGAESLKSQTTDKDEDGSSALTGSIESLADSSAGLCDVESVETDSKANSTSSFSSQLERNSSVVSTPNPVKSSIPTSSQFDFDSPTTYKSLQIQSVKKRRRHAALDSVENMNTTPSQRTPLSAVTFQNPSTPAPSTPYHDAKELSSPLSPNMTPVRKVILRDSIGNGTGPRSRLRNGMSSKLGKPRAFEFESAMKPKKGGKPNRLRKYSLSLIYAQSISQTFIQDLSATTSASNFYFKLLFRFFGIYVLHYIFASLSLRNYVVIGITAVTAMLCHLVYHLLLRMVKLYFGEVIENVKSAIEVLYENCKDLSIRYLRLGSGIAWMDKKYKMGKSEAKEALIRNADSFVATFLIIMVLSTGFLLVSIIDETLSADIKSRLQTAITDSLGHGISWADKKLEEMYPNSNITLSFIYLKLSESYQQLTNQATPTYHDPSILVELNSTSAISNWGSINLNRHFNALHRFDRTSQFFDTLCQSDFIVIIGNIPVHNYPEYFPYINSLSLIIDSNSRHHLILLDINTFHPIHRLFWTCVSIRTVLIHITLLTSSRTKYSQLFQQVNRACGYRWKVNECPGRQY
ncbi:hypothetical protein BKA69DRAFT_540825 [Paraphysoderma sedebokerense]|nr:hypothetical protein BKA69DRAFT_540825 [Paraphysoderma sedebokerense]